MHYEGMIIRPPSEANSILLQVTLGCSHNKCTFCGTFREKRFDIKKMTLFLKILNSQEPTAKDKTVCSSVTVMPW